MLKMTNKVSHTIMRGFTLIEMLLVLVIISIIIYAGINYIQQRTQQAQIDRATAQMQQILNAGLAYYVAYGKWPFGINDLYNGYFLPSTPLSNPWGQPYFLAQGAGVQPPPQFGPAPPMLYVWTSTTQAHTPNASGLSAATANAISGNLPLSYTTGSSGAPPPDSNHGGSPCNSGGPSCYVVAMVNIPGQNLNNASAINFAGVYHHGGCIPVPQCPVDNTGAATMIPQVILVPISVSGKNDSATPDNVYPISSFTAYLSSPTPSANPPACNNGGQAPACGATNPSPTYWRACLQIVTEVGDVAQTRANVNPNDQWGQDVSLAAFTRCSINNEPSGSPLSVYSN